MDKYYLNSAYGILKNKLVKSKNYWELIYFLTTDKRVSKKVEKVFEGIEEQSDELFRNVDFVSYLCTVLDEDEKNINNTINSSEETKTPIQDKFTNSIINSVKTDNPVESIINIKFIETLYGNTIKNDISSNDVLFTLLEGILGLDTIIKSFVEKELVQLRINEIMKNNKVSFYVFEELFSELYNDLQDCYDYEQTLKVLSKYTDRLMPYVYNGIMAQIDDTSFSENKNFEQYENLQERIKKILEDLKKIDVKKYM